ncbi:nitrate/nitrite transporter NrtS [Paraconexibacter antarcticus]|uniref:Nitrate/nitrite transporter NrtS n=1 Tax=Paraconexibacter antarcticus TaxID=2949664 RepID=A0ABY5DTD9_9ACTN|nr:nitrate/nitrite transporter NrtS [Paraconexibacter antarcticus]UTI64342.1 nitrate/nitrite transporter NrtS [Paraconexibacter antarcticus]
MPSRSPRLQQISEALAYCARPEHLRRTLRIAFVVGLLLTAVNQGSVILGGDASTLTWVRSAANFMIPFVVSNLGLLGGRPRPATPEATSTVDQ